jgi:hypothetical protein
MAQSVESSVTAGCTTPHAPSSFPRKREPGSQTHPTRPPPDLPLSGGGQVGVGQTPVWGIAVAQNCRTEKFQPKQTQRLSAKVWGIVPRRIYGAAGRVILPRMTRHKTAQTGLGTPQPRQLLLTAVLRAFAMLVHHVASTLQMIRRRAAVIGTQPTPTDLPRASTDTPSQETPPAAQHRSPIALMVSSTQSVRPSNHEGVLTTPSVSHAPRAIHLPQRYALMEANRAPMRATKGNLPPPVRSTGGGGSPRLRGETEGVRATHTAPTPNKNAAA